MAIATAQNQIASNIFKTWIIMFGFTVFAVGIVYVFALGFGYPLPEALGFTGMALIWMVCSIIMTNAPPVLWRLSIKNSIP